MKIVGLITEYNPFHNGHQYHIQKSLEVTGADAAIVVMSGDYVQRGIPPLSKHLRAEMVLNAVPVQSLSCCLLCDRHFAELYLRWEAVSFLISLAL